MYRTFPLLCSRLPTGCTCIPYRAECVEPELIHPVCIGISNVPQSAFKTRAPPTVPQWLDHLFILRCTGKAVKQLHQPWATDLIFCEHRLHLLYLR
jgi:hypothetical protein